MLKPRIYAAKSVKCDIKFFNDDVILRAERTVNIIAVRLRAVKEKVN